VSAVVSSRNDLLKRGLLLEGVIVAFNILEGIVAVSAGLLANSVALIGFGIDSFVEVTSAVVVFFRLRHEILGNSHPQQIEKLEHRTSKIAGALLVALAIYILVGAGRRLLGYGEPAHESLIGIIMTAISLVVMPLLGWAKLRTARGLSSASLRADSFQTLTCAWLSLTLLIGLLLNAAFGWAWADPLAAIIIVPLILREGWNAWQGRGCCGLDLSASCESNRMADKQGEN
jgi:cation diffusion facilitator family transporter